MRSINYCQRYKNSRNVVDLQNSASCGSGIMAERLLDVTFITSICYCLAKSSPKRPETLGFRSWQFNVWLIVCPRWH